MLSVPPCFDKPRVACVPACRERSEVCKCGHSLHAQRIASVTTESVLQRHVARRQPAIPARNNNRIATTQLSSTKHNSEKPANMEQSAATNANGRWRAKTGLCSRSGAAARRAGTRPQHAARDCRRQCTRRSSVASNAVMHAAYVTRGASCRSSAAPALQLGGLLPGRELARLLHGELLLDPGFTAAGRGGLRFTNDGFSGLGGVGNWLGIQPACAPRQGYEQQSMPASNAATPDFLEDVLIDVRTGALRTRVRVHVELERVDKLGELSPRRCRRQLPFREMASRRQLPAVIEVRRQAVHVLATLRLGKGRLRPLQHHICGQTQLTSTTA